MYLDDFIEFPGYPGLPEIEPRIEELPLFFSKMQDLRFDLAIQLHGSGHIVNQIIALFDARHTAGFFVRGEWRPDEQTYLEYPKNETESWRFLRLMEHLGIPLTGDHLEFPLTQADEEDLQTLEQGAGLINSEYVCLHPGARFLSRRWQPEKFAAVADAVAAEGNRRCRQNIGPCAIS